MSRDTIDELAARAQRWVALENLLFETLGTWARHVSEPPVKRALATWCHRHAWHAGMWRSRLPMIAGRHDTIGDGDGDGGVSGEAGGDDVVIGDGGDDVQSWLEPLQRVLGDPDTATSTDAKLAILVDPVLAAVRGALDEHRAAVDPRLDGPTARILDLVTADLNAEVEAMSASSPNWSS